MVDRQLASVTSVEPRGTSDGSSPASATAVRPPVIAASSCAPCALNAANARRVSAREDANALITIDAAGPDGARDHGARSLDRERSIDGQAKQIIVARVAERRAPRLRARLRNSAMPRPVCADGRHDRRVGKRTRRDRGAHILLDEREPLVVDQIGLRERDDAASYAEQLEDREVLSRLRHHAFVGGNDEQGEVDARRAGDHRSNERLVTGNVDDADRADALERERRETELDRDAAAFFLRQVDRCRRRSARAPASSFRDRCAPRCRGSRRSSACAQLVSLPRVERAKRPIVGEVLAHELPKQSLVRSHVAARR